MISFVRRSLFPLAAVLLLLGLGAPARAQTTLVENLSVGTAFFSMLDHPSQRAAQAFVNDGAAHGLHSVDLPLNASDGAAIGNLSFSLWSALPDGGVGSPVAAFGSAFAIGPDPQPTGALLYRIQPAAPFQLDPGARYWVVLQNTGAGRGFWYDTQGSTPVFTGTGSLPQNGRGLSSDGGSSWSYGGPALHLRVNVTDAESPAVPEPASVLLFLPALAAVGALRRKHRASEPGAGNQEPGTSH